MESVKVLRDTRGRFSKVQEDQISVFRDRRGRFVKFEDQHTERLADKRLSVVFQGKVLHRVWSPDHDGWIYIQATKDDTTDSDLSIAAA